MTIDLQSTSGVRLAEHLRERLGLQPWDTVVTVRDLDDYLREFIEAERRRAAEMDDDLRRSIERVREYLGEIEEASN